MIDRCLGSPPTSVAPLRPLPANRLALFFYRRCPQWFRPKRICSWCPDKRVIHRGGIFSRGNVSHGICKHCSAESLDQARLVKQRRLVLGAAFLFFAIGWTGCEQRMESPARPYRAVRHAAMEVQP